MIRFLLILTIVLFPSQVCIANTYQPSWKVISDIEYVSLSLRSHARGKEAAFQFCETSVCDRLTFKSNDLGAIIRFLDIYIVFASYFTDFPHLAKTGESRPIEYVRHWFLVNKLGDGVIERCSQLGNHAEKLSCTLQNYADVLGVEMWTVREHKDGDGVWPAQKDFRKALETQAIQNRIDRYKMLGYIQVHK